MQTVSHHLLRRTARARRDRLNQRWTAEQRDGDAPYRGPWRWRVVRG